MFVMRVLIFVLMESFTAWGTLKVTSPFVSRPVVSSVTCPTTCMSSRKSARVASFLIVVRSSRRAMALGQRQLEGVLDRVADLERSAGVVSVQHDLGPRRGC